MRVLITGARGFIAKNLIATLENITAGKDGTYCLSEEISLYKYSRDLGKETLQVFCRDCDFVFYLAGVNRPRDPDEYWEGNVLLLKYMLEALKDQMNCCPIMYASSIHAESKNPYGESKRAGEELLYQYSKDTGVPVYIYRLPNVFGKWSRPNYNSVVATFCYNLARDLPIQIHQPEKKLELVYIDDVVRTLVNLLSVVEHGDMKNPISMKDIYHVSLQEIADLLASFKRSRVDGQIPDMKAESFSQRLYSTYLTYLPKEQIKYPCIMNRDSRGSFTELFRTEDRGQVSVNVTKPGFVKGEHWHHTKNEKFIVVKGTGLIRLRKIDSNEILDFHVSGEIIEVVDIPAGYAHNIINIGEEDLVTVMWASECFHREMPDTFSLKVEEE